jgi:thiamine-phosphate pyrophosphorylase
MGLAKRLGADGVHLGQSDGDVRDARALLGPNAQIGVTCHNSRDLAMQAGEDGADYVAFGAFYPSETKPAKYVAEPDLLRWWQSLVELPCVAIGGISVDNAKPLIEAGADFIAVSGGVWAHPAGPDAAVATFTSLLAETRFIG